MASEPTIPGNDDDIVRLQRQIAELQAQLAARQQGDAGHPAPAIDTGGGAVCRRQRSPPAGMSSVATSSRSSTGSSTTVKTPARPTRSSRIILPRSPATSLA
jgi:hypothetical protein